MLLIFVLSIIVQVASAGNLNGEDEKLWKPAVDDVYLQEVNGKISTDNPVTSLAVYDGACYAVMEGRLYTLKDDNLLAVKKGPQEIDRIISADGALWVLTSKGIYRYTDEWKQVDDKHFLDICMHNGKVHGATRDEVYRLDQDKFVSVQPEGGYLSSDITMVMADGSQVLADPVQIGPIHRIASYNETIYVLRPGKIVLFDGRIVNRDFVDWGRLPSYNTRDLLSFGSRLFISTDRGLAQLRGAAMTTIGGNEGLPYENTTVLRQGFARDMWIGTTKGAVRWTGKDWHYFGADHWLPGNNVHDIAVGDKVVYVGTDAGIGIITYEPYTLRKKAEFYERHINEWGHKRLGFIHTIYKNGDEWIREISDNDGGHTAPFLAAMSYKYEVTGDETARAQAVEAFKAMLWLDKVTPKDGFIARAIWSASGDQDNRSRHGSGGLPAKWYSTEDKKWYWKGDTSSDEVIAHFYSVSLFHDLVAEGKEKEMAAQHLKNIASHIIDNGFVMRDMDDKPTRWGRWDPEYLLRPYGSWDRGLNGLEVQAFMLTALGVSGDEKV